MSPAVRPADGPAPGRAAARRAAAGRRTARPVLADPVVAADQGVELKIELKATLENTTSETRLRSRKIRAQNAKKDRRIQRILQVRAAYHCTRPLPPNRSVTQITKLREKATLENLTFETCLRTRDGITLRRDAWCLCHTDLDASVPTAPKNNPPDVPPKNRCTKLRQKATLDFATFQSPPRLPTAKLKTTAKACHTRAAEACADEPRGKA